MLEIVRENKYWKENLKGDNKRYT